MSGIDTSKLDDRTFHEYAGIVKSARYHNRRRMFYENWNSITVAMSAAMLAAGGVLQIYGDTSPIWSVLLFAGAIWCAVDSALGTSKKAGVHNELASQFTQLEKRFASGRNLTDDEFEEARNLRLDVESREPPTLYLLNELCQMSFERSIGVEHSTHRLPSWRKLLVHFLSQEEYTKSEFRLVEIQ